jgi:hypothetical protein
MEEKEDYPGTMMELERRFGDEESCRRYLFALRWPKGFICPRCGGRDTWETRGGLWLCAGCRRKVSVTAGTIFHRSHQPLTAWFRVMWLVTNTKNGVSAASLKQAIGLGGYQTAWTMLQKLRRAMVRPGRDRLCGRVDVDETYWGSPETGVTGRQAVDKQLIIVAAEHDGDGIGRVRLKRIKDATRESLHGFIDQSVELGSTVTTDGLPAYLELVGYTHDRQVQRQAPIGEHLLPRVHRVISLLKRWLLGTHQGAVSDSNLDYYLDEFAFRFNRRRSKSRGKLFYRLAQQAVQIQPTPYKHLIHPNPNR